MAPIEYWSESNDCRPWALAVYSSRPMPAEALTPNVPFGDGVEDEREALAVAIGDVEVPHVGQLADLRELLGLEVVAGALAVLVERPQPEAADCR